MSRVRGRLNALERHYGPPGTCPVCKGAPDGGVFVIEVNADGSPCSDTIPGQCPACGMCGPTTLITVRRDPNRGPPAVGA